MANKSVLYKCEKNYLKYSRLGRNKTRAWK